MDKEWDPSAGILDIAAQYGLTKREQQAFSGICSGLTNKELAAWMKISPSTVKAFLHIIMLKMGVAKRSEIAARAGIRTASAARNSSLPDPPS
jgi:DNA-binding NarL/FixJ family response regulator